MDKVIIIRLGEIFLKGKNRNFFEKILKAIIKDKLSKVECKLDFGRNRYIVSDFAVDDASKIIAILKTIFGINSLSEGIRVKSDFEEIIKCAIGMVPDKGSFRVTSNRADKTFPLSSMEINRELGGRLLDAKKDLKVDLYNSDYNVNVDIRENGFTYLFYNRIQGAGGMPVGSAGKGLLLLSGGIDSPVASYMMAKRGLRLDALHFHSYPYTSEMAQKKVEKLADILGDYCGKMPLICVPFTKIQESINKHCANSYMITIMRRCMMRIAERVALERWCGALVNGESLGQVASQTLESITVTNSVIKSLPVFRPCIGMDKQEILDISIKIGTYETSIEPYEDCCTVFLPEKPVTKPKLHQCEFEESKIPNLQELLNEAINNIEIIKPIFDK